MNKKKLWVIIGILIVFIVVAALLLLNNKSQTNYAGLGNNSNQPTLVKVQTSTVNLTASGFQPQSINIKAGQTVIWVNKSGQDATVNSDIYPTNLLWPFLNLGKFKDGTSVSTIFSKAGKYTYYNYLNPSQKGTVIVE